MDITELTKKAVETASQDSELSKEIKDIVVSIVMLCKTGDGLERAFTFLVDKGRISFSEEKLENPDFQFEMASGDFCDLMTGQAYGMMLMATGKMKMTKGTWAEISKVATPLSVIPKLGKEIALKEKAQPV